MKNNDKEFEKQLETMSPFEIKNRLISYAEESCRKSSNVFLNAGRGNPNWISTLPREAFFLLGEFALCECRRTMNNDDVDLAGLPQERGIASRFLSYLVNHSREKASQFLENSYEYMMKLNIDPDSLVHEWAEGIIGCQYPSPDRILKHTEIIIKKYLYQELCNSSEKTSFDLFAVEGGTAAMCYIFNSLRANKLLNQNDDIAIMTPIFTPYIEIPKLSEFDLNICEIRASQVTHDGYHTWQYPDSELDKLKNTNIKLLCLVNPSNPPSYALNDETITKLIDIVENHNPNLIIITDDVYGTFVSGFKSLLNKLPYNTIGVYSFSKYFGCTGWRLSVIATAKENLIDNLISKFNQPTKEYLQKRYQSISMEPDKLKFIDRLVADSRMVALNHTAGLSTPQQIQMSLFALYSLLDDKSTYKTKLQEIIQGRLEKMWSNTGFKLIDDPLRAGYYSEIDIMVWAKHLYGAKFASYLEENYEPIDFVIRLANETGVVLLNGSGFDGPKWSVRVSLANLNEPDYEKIGKHIGNMLAEYANIWDWKI